MEEQNNSSNAEQWNWKKHKPENLFTVKGTLDKSFFKWWCIILTPFIRLTSKEIDLISTFLKYRHELSKVISDPVVLDSQLMSKSVKEKVIKECGLTTTNYYVITSNLRKRGILSEAGINPKLIPNIRKDSNGYVQLLLLFQDDQVK